MEYLRGNRHGFLLPFRVFLFCNLIDFVAAADFHFTILTTTFRGQIESIFYKGVTHRVLVQRYDLAPGALSTASVAVAIPRFKLPLFLVTLYWIGA